MRYEILGLSCWTRYAQHISTWVNWVYMQMNHSWAKAKLCWFKMATLQRNQIAAMMGFLYVLRKRRLRVKTKEKRKAKFWVREIFKSKASGEYYSLYQELRLQDREYHYRYTTYIVIFHLFYLSSMPPNDEDIYTCLLLFVGIWGCLKKDLITFSALSRIA